MKLSKTLIKQCYNSLASDTKIKKTAKLSNDLIMVYTTQKISDSRHIHNLAYFDIQSVYFNERIQTLESTQFCKNPNAVLRYAEYTINQNLKAI